MLVGAVVDPQWTLTVPLLVGAVLAPTLGRLGDTRRRKGVGFAGLLCRRALQGAALALVPLPTIAGYRTAGVRGIVILCAALVASVVLTRFRSRPAA